MRRLVETFLLKLEVDSHAEGQPDQTEIFGVWLILECGRIVDIDHLVHAPPVLAVETEGHDRVLLVVVEVTLP